MSQRCFHFHVVKTDKLEILKASGSPLLTHLKSKADMTPSCLYAVDHTSAEGPFSRGYPNEISPFCGSCYYTTTGPV